MATDTGQGAQRYHISETNPNDAIGGGGCLCSEGRCEDRGGPYAVFHVIETDSNLSPHVVICAPCAKAVVGDIEGDAERMQAGEKVVEGEAELESTEVILPSAENPVGEDTWPAVIRDDDDEPAI